MRHIITEPLRYDAPGSLSGGSTCRPTPALLERLVANSASEAEFIASTYAVSKEVTMAYSTEDKLGAVRLCDRDAEDCRLSMLAMVTGSIPDDGEAKPGFTLDVLCSMRNTKCAQQAAAVAICAAQLLEEKFCSGPVEG